MSTQPQPEHTAPPPEPGQSKVRFWMVCALILALALPLQLSVDAGLFPDVLNPYYLHLLTIIGMNIILNLQSGGRLRHDPTPLRQ